MDPEKFKSTMSSLNYGNVMLAAAKDYAKDMMMEEEPQRTQHGHIDMDDLMDDPELERLHAERLAQMQKEVEKRQEMKQKGHGEYEDIEEGEFLEVVTQTPKVVAHFYHRDFEACKIMDKHMQLLCKKYFDTRFIKISAQDAPFFTVKLGVKMLPCVIFFNGGVAKDRVAGFDELGGTRDFETAVLEKKMLKDGVIKPHEKTEDDSDSDEEAEQRRSNVRRSIKTLPRDDGDESSDFSD